MYIGGYPPRGGLWGRDFKPNFRPHFALDDHGNEDAPAIGSNEWRDTPKSLETSQLGGMCLAK
jgi:hypothetical protein